MKGLLAVLWGTGSFNPTQLEDFLVYQPGPGPEGEWRPVLPTLETMLGAMAAAFLRANREDDEDCKWESVVLERAVRLTVECGDKDKPLREVKVAGPILVVERVDESGGVVKEYYVDVGVGLLRVDAVPEWVNIARSLEECGASNGNDSSSRITSPREIWECSVEATLELEKLRNDKKLVPAWEISRARTGIALDRQTKTVMEGLMYSLTWSDPHGALTRLVGEVRGVGVALLLELPSGCNPRRPSPVERIVLLGKKRSPTILELVELERAGTGNPLEVLLWPGGPEDESRYLCLTDTPLTEVENPVHPALFPGGFRLLTWRWAVRRGERLDHKKAPPMPATLRGTVTSGYRQSQAQVYRCMRVSLGG